MRNFWFAILIIGAFVGCQNKAAKTAGEAGAPSSEMVLRGEVMFEYEGDYGPGIKQIAGVVWDKEIRNGKDFQVWINSKDFDVIRRQIYEFESFLQKTGGSITTIEAAGERDSPSIRVRFRAPPKE